MLALDSAYPHRLRALKRPPPSLFIQGGPLDAPCVVAIVGSRAPTSGARTYARELARVLARAGAVVASGGALGVDASAHEGAIEAGGRTWAVAGTGHLHCYPPENAELFSDIAKGPGTVIWPCDPDFSHRSGFGARNRVRVALSDAGVVVQARERSGALHAAGCALKQAKPLWIVPPVPWHEDEFAGSRLLIERGGKPFMRNRDLLASLPLSRCTPAIPSPSSSGVRVSQLSGEARAVFLATPEWPAHIDSIASAAALTAQAAMVVLLTLALENVVVEGPPGFFRRTNGHNH